MKNSLNIQKTATGYILSVVSYIFRYIIVYTVQHIGYDSLSKEIYAVRNAVFIVTFVNNALLVLIMSADFEKINYFQGKYSDFNQDWFSDIGSIIVSSMTFNAVYPILEILFFGSLNNIQKMIDQGTIFGL